MELELVGDAGRARILHAQKEWHHRKPATDCSFTTASRKTAGGSPASGPSSYADSVIANHRVAEAAHPLPLPLQRLGEASGGFSGAEDCGVAGRPGRREEEQRATE